MPSLPLRLWVCLILLWAGTTACRSVHSSQDNASLLWIEPTALACEEEGLRAVFLTAPDGGMGFGHTSLLFETEPKTWYYFSWQYSKVVFREVPDHVMVSMDALNDWINTNPGLQTYHTTFDSATLLHGDFSRSVMLADSLFSEYIQQQKANRFLHPDSIDSEFLMRNRDYNYFFNNCLNVALDLLNRSVLCTGEPFSEVVSGLSIIPNRASRQMELLFE